MVGQVRQVGQVGQRLKRAMSMTDFWQRVEKIEAEQSAERDWRTAMGARLDALEKAMVMDDTKLERLRRRGGLIQYVAFLELHMDNTLEELCEVQSVQREAELQGRLAELMDQHQLCVENLRLAEGERGSGNGRDCV